MQPTNKVVASEQGFVSILTTVSKRTSALKLRFFYMENPTLGVGVRRAYSYEYEIKTPFARMMMRPDNCNKSKRRSFEQQMTKAILA